MFGVPRKGSSLSPPSSGGVPRRAVTTREDRRGPGLGPGASRRVASGLVGGDALRAVDGADDLVRVGDAAEREVAVVGAGRVEVHRADAQDAVDEALLGVDVLDAVDPRLLDLLGE